VMIDSLLQHLPRARNSGALERIGVAPHEYAVLTLHRPSNVDDSKVLAGLVEALEHIGSRMPIVFPVHPRTLRRFREFGMFERLSAIPRVRICEPLGYLDFLDLTSRARIVLTDSGGLQEETTALGIPCLTLRHNTERPITISEGTNTLVGTGAPTIIESFEMVHSSQPGGGRRPELWDGHAAERITDVLRGWTRG
jgi:UDP-N-acetylglucosamine 2-epimerase (non-hydrolysing)